MQKLIARFLHYLLSLVEQPTKQPDQPEPEPDKPPMPRVTLYHLQAAGKQPATDFELQLQEVEKTVVSLRRRLSAGSITPAMFNNTMRELMVLDGQTWWMVGPQSNKWFKYDWVEATPPGRTSSEVFEK
jgi:hypothetical protein